MKKRLLSLILVLLMFVLVGCDNKPITVSDIYKLIEESDNYKMTMNINMSIATMNSIIEYDGNVSHTKETTGILGMSETEEYYTSIESGKQYKYEVGENGKITKTEYIQEDSDSDSDETWKYLFDDDSYTFNEEDNTFYMKDNVIINAGNEGIISEATIKIGEDGEYYTFTYSLSASGLNATCKIVISDLGKVEIELPEVN